MHPDWLLGAGPCGTQVLLCPGVSPLSPCGHHVCCSPPSCPGRVLTMLLLVPGAILSSAPKSSSSQPHLRAGAGGGSRGALGTPVLSSQPRVSPSGTTRVLWGGAHTQPEQSPRFFGVQEASAKEGAGDTRVPAAVEAEEREGPAVPVPSRGPGATAAGIFSSDMCHLSCHRGGGGGGRCRPSRRSPRCRRRSRLAGIPVLVRDIGTHRPRQVPGEPRGGQRGLWVPPGREGYFELGMDGHSGSPGSGSGFQPRREQGRAAMGAGMGTGTLLPALHGLVARTRVAARVPKEGPDPNALGPPGAASRAGTARCWWHPECSVKARPLRASVSPSPAGVTMPCGSPAPGSAVPSGPVLLAGGTAGP